MDKLKEQTVKKLAKALDETPFDVAKIDALTRLLATICYESRFVK